MVNDFEMHFEVIFQSSPVLNYTQNVQRFNVSTYMRILVWNSLPDSLKHFATSRKHFQEKLKTYLFRKAYAPASE